MLPSIAPKDWRDCAELLKQLDSRELLNCALAASQLALPIWIEAVSSDAERQPVAQAVAYLRAWLCGECDGSKARLLGDEVYRAVRSSNIPTGTPERSAAFAAAHAVFALAFHLGQCRKSGKVKVFAAVRNCVGHASDAAQLDVRYSLEWGERWLIAIHANQESH